MIRSELLLQAINSFKMPTSNTSPTSGASNHSISLTAVSSFMSGIMVGIGIATMWPNWLPNLEYHRRNAIAEWWGRLLAPTSASSSASPLLLEDKVDVFSIKTEIHSMVLPNWIDRNRHMNNARYIYELNFARRHFFQKLQIIPLLTSYQCNFILQSQTIRYRRELKLWQTFIIEIRLLDWNDQEHSFYLESKFLDAKTKFVHAIHYSKYRIVSAIDKKVLSSPKHHRLSNADQTLSISTTTTTPLPSRSASPLPTPSKLLKELHLIDGETIISRISSEDSDRCGDPELLLPQTEQLEQEDRLLLKETRRKLSGVTGDNSFLVFWETANTISSQQLHPQKNQTSEKH